MPPKLKLVHKTCPQCGTPFISNVLRFCTRKCAVEFFRNPDNRKHISHICTFCGESYTSNKPASKYCSPSCRMKGYALTVKKRPKKQKPKNATIDDGLMLGKNSDLSENALQYELDKKKAIEKSRKSITTEHTLVQINPRTWVVAKPGTDPNQVSQQLSESLKRNKSIF